jgi:putative CocE/NonD family hydrolase
MFGPSYLGLTQWAVADLAPGELRALAPAVAPSSMRESVVYQHDVLALETVISWMHQVVHQELPPWRVVAAMATQRRDVGPAFAALPVARADRRAFGNEVDFFQEWLAHEAPDDPWWDPVDFRPHLTSSPPASMVTGWFDIFLPWQVRDFGALVAAGREARITIGPWTHTSPGGLGAMLRDGLDWFDTHLRGGPPSRGRGSVRLFVMGSDRWIETPSWPPPAEVTRWHLHADGRLDRDAPAASSPSRYRFDPADPPSSVGGAGLDWRTSGRRRQTEREARGDVLTFTSDALRDDVTVAGPIAADLHLRSATAHADVFVRLCVVSARGRSTNLSDGIVRLHPGTSAPAAGTETDDDVRHVRVEMWPTATTFRRGERIRLQVSGGAHPRYARNLGTGAPLATGSAMRTSEHEVRHDPAHPSCVELPVTTL